MPDWLLVLVLVLAIHRLTRLLVRDNLPLGHDVDGEPDARWRMWVADRWGDDSWQVYLSTCPWCVSIYVGALVVGASCVVLERGVPAPILVWLTASTLTGVIAEHEVD